MTRLPFAVLLIALCAQPLCADTGLVPLTDLGPGIYLGFEGGLYPGGSNDMPDDHRLAGLALSSLVRPLDAGGFPSPDGSVVMISIGMSNTQQEFCGGGAGPGPCTPWSFVGQALADDRVDRRFLSLVNGAAGGQAADAWDSPDDANWERLVNESLPAVGLTRHQVQAAWIKVASNFPVATLPAEDADAWILVRAMGDIARAARHHFPNLRLAYFSSRIYGGYTTNVRRAEPLPYESGLAVKWVVAAQIEQMRSGRVDPVAGDLDFNGATPWIAWGPYLWADGRNPRSDGLVWTREDLESDGVHPSRSGETKVGELLLRFFLEEPTAARWFRHDEPVRRRPVRGSHP